MALKITIITAVYNRKHVIERAIRSIQSQDYPHIQLIVVDGQSTDGTLDILSNILRDNDILISEADCGIYDALNKGIKLATGDIVGVLHSDDFYKNNSVLSKIAGFFNSSATDLVYGDVEFFSENKPSVSVRKYVSGVFSLRRLAWGWMPAHPAIFLRRQLFSLVGPYKLDYKIAADYEFLCRLLTYKKIISLYIPEVLVRMAVGGLSTSGIKSTIILNREVFRACIENGISTSYFKILSKYPIKFMGRIFR